MHLPREHLRALVATTLIVLGISLGVASPAQAGDGTLNLGLPWPTGESWTLVSGCHSWIGNASPCSSLDFAGGSGDVTAPAAGIVHRDGGCASAFVRVDLGNGWSISFYHLQNIPAGLTTGTSVSRGQYIGHIGTAIPCRGSAPTAHTHVTLWRFAGAFVFGPAQEASWPGIDIGGYTVTWNGLNRQACLVRVADGTTRCVGQQVYNDGTTGTGNPPPATTRSDFNGDGKDDIAWYDQGDGGRITGLFSNGSTLANWQVIAGSASGQSTLGRPDWAGRGWFPGPNGDGNPPVPGGGGPGGGGPGGGNPGGGGPSDGLPLAVEGLASFDTSPKTVGVSKGGNFKFSFTSTPLRSGKISLTSAKRVKIGSKKRYAKLAAKTFISSSTGNVKVTFKLSSKYRKALKKANKLRFKVIVVLGGRTFNGKVTLKAPKEA